ncbi:hypothetical protein HTT03_14085 [Sulfitobacter sp. S0837]|uniref:hypothetical protein n=1 Tax=Sulfitobacter maritimus TaxID=2741719 RepID=UPI0015817C50|nr:hypothetical protein [Sulfitobacter maritimus]NUH66413.1 hypothetical protein [Sulfitobacter maritimus]
MRSVPSLLVLLYPLVATPALAGPWLREEGKGFRSTSVSASYFYDLSQSTYLEYGWRDDLTLGLDITTSQSRFGELKGSGTLFLRLPLGTPGDTGRWAYDLGLGASWRGELVSPHIKAGLSWGRGFTKGDRNGWLTVDASLKWDFGLAEQEIKIDSTAGFDFTDLTSAMVQLFVTTTPTTTSVSLAPSVILSPDWAKHRIQIGTETPIDRPEDTLLKLGLWREF